MPARTVSPPLPAEAATHLAQLAEAEAAALRDRHRARDAAIRRYETARATIDQAEQAITDARADQVAAIAELYTSGLDTGTIAKILAVDERRVREARPTARERSRSGSTSSPAPAETAAD